MNKLKAFWYISEAAILAIYISFFAIISNNIWLGILAGVFFIILRNLVSRLLEKVKVSK